MRRSWLALLLAPVSFAVVAACVGDDPDTATNGAGTDGGNDNSSGGPDGSNSNGDSSINPGDDGGGGDSGDAAAPKCGYPGEDCCVAPSLPCRAGTTCGTSNQKCMVNELGAVGEYTYIQTSPTTLIEQHVASAFYDSNGWKAGANVITVQGIGSSWHPYELISSAPSSYHVVMTQSAEGKMMTTSNGSTWSKCEVGQSCVGPAIPSPAFWSVGRIGGDIWIGATNKIYRCASGAGNCTETMNGLASTTWGTITLVGTSAQDVWFSAQTRAFHYDGTIWTLHDNLKASTIFEVRKDDVWVAGTTFQHWNGTAWSDEMTIAGAPAPGTVTSMSGSATNDVWAVGVGGGGVYTAHWDGMGWTLKTVPANTTGTPSIYAPSPIEAFLACESGIYRWDGAQWTKMTVASYDAGQAEQPFWREITGPAKPRP